MAPCYAGCNYMCETRGALLCGTLQMLDKDDYTCDMCFHSSLYKYAMCPQHLAPGTPDWCRDVRAWLCFLVPVSRCIGNRRTGSVELHRGYIASRVVHHTMLCHLLVFSRCSDPSARIGIWMCTQTCVCVMLSRQICTDCADGNKDT